MDIVVTTISLIIGLVGCLVGVAGHLRNKDSKTESDAEWKGSVNAKLDIIVGLKSDVEEIKGVTQDHETRITVLELKKKKKGISEIYELERD